MDNLNNNTAVQANQPTSGYYSENKPYEINNPKATNEADLKERAKKFAQMVNKKSKKDGDGKDEEKDDENSLSKKHSGFQEMSNLLAERIMQQNRMPNNSSDINKMKKADNNNITAANSVDKINELYAALLDKISISEAALNNKKEVRLFFKNDVLDGTQVSVSLNSGVFDIKFLTSSENSLNLLLANKSAGLNYLESNLSKPVDLKIELASERQQEDNDSRRRSRGLDNINYDEVEGRVSARS